MAAQQDRRNARARALGYRNDYDYRIHNWGKEPPSAPRPTGAELSRRRGHFSYKELLDRVRSKGDKHPELWSLTPKRRNKLGQIIGAEVTVVLRDGSQETYTLAGKHLKRGKGKVFQDLGLEAERSGRRNLPPTGKALFDIAPADIRGGLIIAGDMGADFSESDYGAMMDAGAAGDWGEVEGMISDYAGVDFGWDDLIDAIEDEGILVADPYTGEL